MRMNMGTYKPIHGTQGRFTSLKTELVRLWFWTKIGVVVSLFTVVAYSYGVAEVTSTVYAQNVIAVPQALEQEAPVLQRIADCESGDGTPNSGSQFNKSGQVTFKVNTNGTVDIGEWQINSTWDKQATKLGLDLTKEKDNYAMAKWIYENRGTGDWSSSAKCWQR